MAGIKVFDMTAAGAMAPGDLLPVVDISDTTGDGNGTTKKSTLTNFFGAVPVSIFSSPGTPANPVIGVIVPAGSSEDPIVLWKDTDGGNTWHMGMDNDVSDQLAISLNVGLTTPAAFFDVAGNRPTFPQGIVFNDETLTEYDEGTWVPVLSDGTNSAAHSLQIGRYTRIGNRVHINFTITISDLLSVNGPVRITGLPFTSEFVVSDHSFCCSEATGLAITAGINIVANMANNVSFILLKMWTLTTGTADMTEAEISADGSFTMSGVYEV